MAVIELAREPKTGGEASVRDAPVGRWQRNGVGQGLEVPRRKGLFQRGPERRSVERARARDQEDVDQVFRPRAGTCVTAVRARVGVQLLG